MNGLKHKNIYILIGIVFTTLIAMFVALTLIFKNVEMTKNVSSLVNKESNQTKIKAKQINANKTKITYNLVKAEKKQEQKRTAKMRQEKLIKMLQLKKLKEQKMLEKKQKELTKKTTSLANNAKNEKIAAQQNDNTKQSQEPVEEDNSDIGTLLKSGGLKPVQVNAVIANLNRESTLNPNADNGAGNQGLAQWGGSRLSNLKATCGGLGTTSCQINFLLSEMKSGINGFNINTFNSYGDVDSANGYFKATFEGAA